VLVGSEARAGAARDAELGLLMRGALAGLERLGVALVGGHTLEVGTALIGFAMIGLFASIGWWLPKVPASMVNLPSRKMHEYWTAAENRPELNRKMAEDLEWIGAATALLFAWITGGESLHNNHHAYPRSAKFSVRRSEFDPSWPFIRALAAIRLLAIIGPPVALAHAPVPVGGRHAGE
jgi:hypothetical protein